MNGGGTFGSVAAAETALRTSHLDVLNIVNNDATLQGLATQNGANGFLATPATLPDGVTAATAPHANLAEIGAIFNDAASRILGGVNDDNRQIITDDMNAVANGLHDLIQAQPMLFGGLTGVHADTVMRQAQLEIAYINQAGISPDAGRASNDNILDMIDIIQGDTNLANMASQGGVTGFSVFPDALNPTPRFQDNDAQTNFWANFIADGNSLGQQAIQLVGGGDANAVQSLIAQLQTFEKNATNFDLAQGGIFEARFDNELTPSSTLGAEVDAIIKGLTEGNAALVTAAAQVIHDNAADVGGNNIPVTGGTYNPDGLTLAEVLSTAAPVPAVPRPPRLLTLHQRLRRRRSLPRLHPRPNLLPPPHQRRRRSPWPATMEIRTSRVTPSCSTQTLACITCGREAPRRGVSRIAGETGAVGGSIQLGSR